MLGDVIGFGSFSWLATTELRRLACFFFLFFILLWRREMGGGTDAWVGLDGGCYFFICCLQVLFPFMFVSSFGGLERSGLLDLLARGACVFVGR